jgi:hypothetical protein
LFTPYFWKKIGLSAARAAIGAVVAGALVPVLAISNGDFKGGGLALATLAGVGVTAGVRAAQAAFTQLETDAKN